MKNELHHEAKNEVLVLEAIAKLGPSNAQQIATEAGLSTIATRMALRRQHGYWLERRGQTWLLLDEPGDGPGDGLPFTSPSIESRVKKLTLWLECQGIAYKHIWKSKGRFFWVVEKPARHLQIGDRFTLRHNGQRRTNRVVLSLQKNGPWMVVFYQQGKTQNACREYALNELVEVHHAIWGTEIDQLVIEEMA
jgi:hypothetical protein